MTTRTRMTYANVTATLALIVALGGTGYAAGLGKNSVGTKQLKANAVTGAKVKAGSLRASDFKAGQLPAGEQGPPGTVGSATVRRTTAAADLADGAKGSYNAFCLPGQQAIGGGGRGDATTSELTNVSGSRPAISDVNTEPPADGQGFTGWRITVSNPAGGAAESIRPEVWVVCVAS